jgi:hypothetical protein
MPLRLKGACQCETFEILLINLLYANEYQLAKERFIFIL